MQQAQKHEKNDIRHLFETMAQKYPSFKPFLEQDCLAADDSGSMFDFTDSTGKILWFPYLKISSGTEHEVMGEFCYARPAWDGTEEDAKYRYLGKTAEFYVLGKGGYGIACEKSGNNTRVTSRFLPSVYQAGDQNFVIPVKVLYLATYVKDLKSYAIVALEGFRTRAEVVNAIYKRVRNAPVLLTLKTAKVNSEKGTYFSITVDSLQEVPEKNIPFLNGNSFMDIVQDIKTYYKINMALRENTKRTGGSGSAGSNGGAGIVPDTSVDEIAEVHNDITTDEIDEDIPF